MGHLNLVLFDDGEKCWSNPISGAMIDMTTKIGNWLTDDEYETMTKFCTDGTEIKVENLKILDPFEKFKGIIQGSKFGFCG